MADQNLDITGITALSKKVRSDLSLLENRVQADELLNTRLEFVAQSMSLCEHCHHDVNLHTVFTDECLVTDCDCKPLVTGLYIGELCVRCLKVTCDGNCKNGSGDGK